jgi:hypothetical protein
VPELDVEEELDGRGNGLLPGVERGGGFRGERHPGPKGAPQVQAVEAHDGAQRVVRRRGYSGEQLVLILLREEPLSDQLDFARVLMPNFFGTRGSSRRRPRLEAIAQ